MKKGQDTKKSEEASKGLGKGLNALLGDLPPSFLDDAPIRELALTAIDNDPNQPRREFDEAKLDELAKSIEACGIMQPIIVAPQGNERYRIVAGERRFRAAHKAGLKVVPCIVKDLDDKKTLEFALVENLQREDLNPMEEAEAFNRLMQDHGLTQQEIADEVGKSRSAVANAVRLLSLPPYVTAMISEGTLSTGHAKVLLGLDNAEAQCIAAQQVVKNGLSVRETEEFIRAAEDKAEEAVRQKQITRRKNQFAEAQDQLTRALGTKVRIAGTESKGRITIEYVSKEHLEALFEQLKELKSEA